MGVACLVLVTESPWGLTSHNNNPAAPVWRVGYPNCSLAPLSLEVPSVKYKSMIQCNPLDALVAPPQPHAGHRWPLS